MKKILLLLLLIPSVAFAGAPSRPKTYTAGTVINPDDNNTNESTLYNYLQAGVDTYVASSIESADIAANTITADDIAADAIGASELANDSVASANIIDGSIVNADVNSAANITASKLDSTVVETNTTQTISGDKTLSGTTDLTGTWKIDGTEVTSTATELNLLGGVSGTVMTEGDTAGGILGGTYPSPTANTHIRAGLYYEPDNTCVLALAGYNFDPATATTFKDSSLYGNDFTIVSTPPEGAGKVSKTCVDLDGVADGLSIADGSYGDFGDCDDITIECLVFNDAAGSNRYIWQNGSGIGDLKFDTNNKIVVTLLVGTGTATITSNSAYASTTVWYHIVVTYQSTDSTLRLFVNGVIDGTDTTKSGDVDAASGDVFYIGNDGGTSDWFNGKIDGFRILRRDMLVAEALARYNAFK